MQSLHTWYLPAGPQSGLHHLVALSTNPNASAFTKEDEDVLLRSKHWEVGNWWTLRTGLVICTLLSIAPAILGLKIVQDWESATPAHSNLMFIITTLYAGAIGMVNYLCTGTIPDRAAMFAIEGSMVISRVHQSYERIAMALLDYKAADCEETLIMARALDPAVVEAALCRCVPADIARGIMNPVVHARDAVLTGAVHDEAPPLVKIQWRLLHLTLGAARGPATGAPHQQLADINASKLGEICKELSEQ